MIAMASVQQRIRRAGKPVRRAAAGLAVVALAVAGGAAVASSDSDDGRGPSDVPGAPTDARVQVDDSNDGRADGAAVVVARSASVSTPSPAATDNGRGGNEPAFGPNPIASDASSSAAADSGSFDTDSGEAPVSGDANVPGARGADTDDRDVPGAPTASEIGSDAPANDQDG